MACGVDGWDAVSEARVEDCTARPNDRETDGSAVQSRPWVHFRR